MRSEATRRGGLETGGVLLGWRERDDVVVTHVVGPGPLASHEAKAFSPDSEWQAAQIAELYEASGRRLAYLGDWHTHPVGVARPSRRDEATLVRIASTRSARCPDPVMVILGAGDAPTPDWRPHAFVLPKRRPWFTWAPVAREASLYSVD